MNKSYQEHFNQRGSAYDQAMQANPDARRAEFMLVIEAAKLVYGMTVADVPAGGGYLKNYLPPGCDWLAHEPCASFTNHHVGGSEQSLPLLPLPWSDASVDVAISLAGVHHLQDKRAFFADLHRVVKPGGRLVIADVAAESAVAGFLDGYIGAHNSTGHEGEFLNEQTLDELQQAGWSGAHYDIRDFHWVFHNRYDMASFCHKLFDLRTSTLANTQAEIEAQLGVDDLADGIGMRWSLMTIIVLRD
jgi:SAM-dependent methyltransferase